MKGDELGYDGKSGWHDRRLTAVESRFVGILWVDHVGEENLISADVLAITLYSGIKEDVNAFLKRHTRDTLEEWKREIRYLQNHLLQEHDKIPVYSKAGPNGGYWIAATEEEGHRFYDRFRKRGLTGLVKAARGKQAALVDMVQQLSFGFDELQDRTPGFAKTILTRVAAPTPIEVVDAFLDRMLKNPEKFTDGLRKIGDKYGGVLLPREQIAAMKAKTAELQQLVAGL